MIFKLYYFFLHKSVFQKEIKNFDLIETKSKNHDILFKINYKQMKLSKIAKKNEPTIK
jgi:hypothetical protein